MAIKFKSMPGGGAPEYVHLVPGAAFGKHALLINSSGKVVKAAGGANALATTPLYLSEETATGDATPATVRCLLLTPGMILEAESTGTTAVVNNSVLDVNANGDLIDSADSAAANGKVRVICMAPGETKANTVAGAKYWVTPLSLYYAT